MANANASINENLIQNVNIHRGNTDVSDIAELGALGLQVDNKDPLPENLENVGTMNCAAEAVGTWINPIVCPCIVENCRNLKGWFQSMSWEIIAEANELEIFKVRNFL